MKQYSALCCYFGAWPSYFQVWLNSCSYNVGIDFYLVTDISVAGYHVPCNVHIVKMSFAEVQQLVKSKFPDLKISLNTSYKLCDFKTAYGYIFADIFRNYSYWGFLDIDTIWGDIVSFIPHNEDNHLIKIFPCGHLCFIRNKAPYNKVFELVNQVANMSCRNNMIGKQVVTWQECFSSSNNYYYDEEGGLEPLFTCNSMLSELSYQQVDFDNIMPPWRFDHFTSINFPQKCFLVYNYNCGKLERIYLNKMHICREQVSYVHLSKRQILVRTDDFKHFSLVPNKIITSKKWNIFMLLICGRPRYIYNFIGRAIAKVKRLI